MKKNLLYVLFSLILTLFFTGCQEKPKCFSEVTAFDKIANAQILEDKYGEFKKNGAVLVSKIEYGKYMNSLIKPHIKTKDIDKLVSAHINGSSKDFLVKYSIIENDKLDPGKKSQKCKIFAGYLLFEFFYKDKLFYKVQIDFMSTKGEDIQKRVDCVFKMLEYHYKK
jgi:hypothetical protein